MKRKIYSWMAFVIILCCCSCAKQEQGSDTANKSTKQEKADSQENKEQTESALEENENTFADQPDTMKISLPDGSQITVNKISAGSFQMGSYEGVGEDDELPVRDITITRDFYIGIYEVTQAQWKAIMGDNPSGFVGDDLPVETVSWGDCMEFCEKLSELSGYHISLPTEAQWEYACRAGSKSKWFFGEDESEYGKYATTNLEEKTLPVGSFKPNPNGLYDMYGNVMEWCLDYYTDKYPEDDVTDPTGCEMGETRISRGGGWGESPDSCRSGYRNACGEDIATDGIGFRIVVNP